MEQYKLIETILDDITNIPYSIFYDKYSHGKVCEEERFEGFCVWISLLEKQREAAFSFLSLEKVKSLEEYLDYFKTHNTLTKYLKSYKL